jgi:hypothetical protein
MKIREFQQMIERIYGEKDRARGLAGTYMWFGEEVGELTRALRRGDDRPTCSRGSRRWPRSAAWIWRRPRATSTARAARTAGRRPALVKQTFDVGRKRRKQTRPSRQPPG